MFAYVLVIKFEWNLSLQERQVPFDWFQPIDPQLRSQYKATLKDSGGPGTQVHHKASSARRTGGLSSNLLPETYDDITTVGLANNGAQYYPVLCLY